MPLNTDFVLHIYQCSLPVWEYVRIVCMLCIWPKRFTFDSELMEDLERSPHAAAIAECFVERVSTQIIKYKMFLYC